MVPTSPFPPIWGLPLAVSVPCPKVSKLLCGWGHLPLRDVAPPCSSHGGLPGNFRSWGALPAASGALGCVDASPPPAKGVEGAGGGVAGSAPRSFVCALAPQRLELEGGTAARAEDHGRRQAAPTGCGGHASPGIRGLLPGPGGRGQQERGAVWPGGHFRSRDGSLGSEVCPGPVAGQGAQGVCGGMASAPAGAGVGGRRPPEVQCLGAADPPPVLSGSLGPLRTCPFLLPLSP